MTREEAINEIRTWAIPSEKGREVLETLIPELAENEDESLKNKSGYYKAGKFWKASTLWNATKNKIPQRVSNRYILQECTWNIGNLQDFANEVKNVQEVSLDYPIILDMNGNIIDGAHRVVKAYLEGKDIDIVYIRDDEWPEPDYDEEKAVKESEDERIRKWLLDYAIEMIAALESDISLSTYDGIKGHDPEAEAELAQWQKARAYLERQKDASKAIEAVERIDKCIDDNLANAHDMKDSNPDKKYYRGWDDALGKMAGILQDVYSNEKQKEQSLRDFIDDFPYSDEQKEQKQAQTSEEKEYIRTIKSIISDFIRDKKPENLAYYQRIYDWLDGRYVPFSCGHENGQPADPVFSKQEYESYPIISTDTTSAKPAELDGKALLYTADKSYQIGFRDGVASVKPAEWSEEYREEDLRTRFAFYTYKDEDETLYLSNLFVEEASRNKGFGTKILQAAEKVAETIGATTICLKVKQDSPANAWYRKHGYGYVTFEDGYDWLKKNLEYLKPAKSAEWSEEDEKDVAHIIRVLDDCYAYGKHDLSKTDHENLVGTLKSLRPSWKPSEM